VAGAESSGGAHLDYWLRAAPASELRIEIVDAAGRHVRGFSSTASAKGEEQPPEWPDLEAAPDTLPVAPGANRFVWDLRYEPPVRIPGAFYTDLAPEGPVAPPGRYTVRLTLGGLVVGEAPLELRLDPRLAGSETAVASAFALGLAVRDEMDVLHRTVNEIRAARGRCAAQARRMDEIEGELMQVKRKSSEGNLKFPVMLDDEYDTFRSLIDVDAAPTAAQVAEHNRMAAKLKALVARWQGMAAACPGGR